MRNLFPRFQGGGVGGGTSGGPMNATFAAATNTTNQQAGQIINNRTGLNAPAGILKNNQQQGSAGPGVGGKSQATPVVGFTDKTGQKEQRIQSDFDEIVRQERERELERRKHVPVDLGRDIYNILCDNFKEKKQLSVKDPQVLFDFWKVLNKAEKQNSYKGEVVKPLTEREAKKLNVYELGLYRRKERKFNMSVLARAHPLDVMLTLKTHHEQAMQEIEEVKEKQHQKRLEANEIAKKKNEDYIIELKSRQSDRMEELTKTTRYQPSNEYDDDEEGGEYDENQDHYNDRGGQSQYGESNENPTPEQLEQQAKERAKIDTQIREAFVEMLIVLFRKRYPMQRVYKNQEDLKQFWEEEIPDKEEKNLDVSQEQAHKYIDDYFFFKGLDFFLLRRDKIGYDTFDQEELIEFYLTLTKGEKKRKGLNFESESDVIKMIAYYLQRAKEQNEELAAQQVEQEEMRQKYFEKLKTQVLRGKEIHATDLNTLSMAKDRLLVGKSLLQLRHQYPQDKILRKMILDEFQENKIAKHPLEYDCKDEVTEAKIQERSLIEVHHLSGRSLQLSDLNAPLNQRTKIIASLFEEEIENYYYHMEDRVKQSQREKAEVTTQMKSLRQFLEQEAQRFIHLRKRRFTQTNIPTVNEFLSTLYHDASNNSSMSKALQKHFPHSTAGQSKKLAQISFPYSFKRFFFEVVRSYAANLHKDAITKLPFWAPSGKNYRTLNYKVKKLSRDAKNAERWEKYCERMNSKRVWDNSDLISEKLKVMMTFEEAKECTFEPMVGLRAPLEMRGVLKSRQLEYGQSVHDLLFSRQPNFEKWVDRMGPDFRFQFPHVHKFGAYRRCLRYLSQSMYNEAATLLFETFQVEAIRNFFAAKTKDIIQSKKTVANQLAGNNQQQIVFTIDRCTPDEEKVKIITRENFEDDTMRKFLEDVYFMVIIPLDRYIANLDKDLKSLDQLKKTQDEHNNQLQNQTTYKRSSNFDASLNERIIDNNSNNASSYKNRSQNPKSIICPLKENCPNVLNSRWPKGNTRNSVPTGANCEYAHSYAELKFVDEKKAKVKALTQRIQAISKQLESGVDPLAESHWNPANNIFVKCTGCGSMGACSLCQMKKVNVKRIEELKERSAATYQRLSNTRSVQVKQEVKQKLYESIAFKVSSIQRANILYSKERFSEAFDVISKAALFVKEELQVKELENSQKQLHWSKKLNVPIDSAKSLIAKRSVSNEKNAASITLFAEKTGLAPSATGKHDNDEFLNYQIQLLYLKIERQLMVKKKDIAIMSKKIEKLETEEINQQQKSQQPFNSTQKLKKKHADLVTNERKIKNLQNAIHKTQEAMLNSTTPAPWNPTSAVDAILDIDKLNEQNLNRNILTINATQKSIYNRDPDDLVTNPLYKATHHDTDYDE